MGFVRKITGQDAAKRSANAAATAGDLQQQATVDASALLNPYQELGQSGLDQSSFLTDPNAQFDFLQNNPLFQMGLDNANEQTLNMAATRGRLSSGDTLQQLNNNSLLNASPLIQQQKQSIGNLLTIGQNTASNQGNLLTGGAAAQSAGLVGAANARNQGDANLGNIFGAIAAPAIGAFTGGVGGAVGSSLLGGAITPTGANAQGYTGVDFTNWIGNQ